VSRRNPTKTQPSGRPTVEYTAWDSMKKRCHSPSAGNFKHYGARGVAVCQEWRDSFEVFLAHIGPRPSPLHSVDRIDGTRGYEPGNVRWATKKVQQNNVRTNVRVDAHGMSMTIAEWADHLGASAGAMRMRIARGADPVSVIEAFAARKAA
jgi:hypothetical protein